MRLGRVTLGGPGPEAGGGDAAGAAASGFAVFAILAALGGEEGVAPAGEGGQRGVELNVDSGRNRTP